MSNTQPRFSPVLLLKLLICLGGITVPLAVAAVENGARIVSSTTQARLDRAILLLDEWSGKGEGLAQAKSNLEAVLRDDPRSASAYREYARYYLSEGHLRSEEFRPGTLDAAERSLDKALEIAPDFAEAYILQGHVYRLMGKPARAKAALEMADRLGSSDPWLQLNWAELLIDDGRLDEAAARYKRVAADKTSLRTTIAAYQGLINYYKKVRRVDEVDAMYRASIALAPGDAWLHGNYAGFLLCWRDDAEAAISEATKALDLMDYGIARSTLAAALYFKWAALAMDGNKLADQAMAAARQVLPNADPAAPVKEMCGMGSVLTPVLEAMLLTGEGERIPAMVSGVLAADAGTQGAPGLFVMKVQASGRHHDRLYLNSETDYRDPRNLSLVFAPEAVAAFKRKHGDEPDVFLQGKKITALGAAQQVKIHFFANGAPTEKYYYQTQMVVSKPEHILVAEQVEKGP